MDCSECGKCKGSRGDKHCIQGYILVNCGEQESKVASLSHLCIVVAHAIDCFRAPHIIMVQIVREGLAGQFGSNFVSGFEMIK